VDSECDETDEEMLAYAPSGCRRYAHANEAVGCHAQFCFVTDTMLEVDANLAMQPRKGEECTGGDEVVPVSGQYKYSMILLNAPSLPC